MEEIESRLYGCFKCQNLIAYQDDICSKEFQAGRKQRAFLFAHTENLEEGTPEDRSMITGLHKVSSVRCNVCEEEVGWKYIKAYNQFNKYKEGKTVLEVSKIDKMVKPPFR